ncbi:hypothetical protein L9F63_013275, partial [Diploptera punctata]
RNKKYRLLYLTTSCIPVERNSPELCPIVLCSDYRSSMERTPSSLKQTSSPEDCEVTKRSRETGNGSACHTPEFRMSVLLAREEENHKDQTTKSPLLVRHVSRPNSRDKSALRPRDTVRLVNEKTVVDQDEKIFEKETLRKINKYDEDSEAEKLSPLLDAATSTDPLPLDSVVVPTVEDLEDDDDMELKVEVGEGEDELTTMTNSSQECCCTTGKNHIGGGETDSGPVAAAGEDSDYYTPEDPATTILSPLHSDKERPITSSAPTSNVPSSVESTPGRWVPNAREGLIGVSLPGTPLSTTSHLSNRSSGDSYSSSSSTRQLLAATGGHHELTNSQDKAVQL